MLEDGRHRRGAAGSWASRPVSQASRVLWPSSPLSLWEDVCGDAALRKGALERTRNAIPQGPRLSAVPGGEEMPLPKSGRTPGKSE